MGARSYISVYAALDAARSLDAAEWAIRSNSSGSAIATFGNSMRCCP